MTTTSKSSQRAKFSYVNRKDIDKLIELGKIDANDIIYTKDTHENIFISKDFSIIPIQSKIYRYSDVTSAEKELNINSDTYEGQLVAIANNGSYIAYIVNKNFNNSFYVTKISDVSTSVDYNTIGNRPINNILGDLSSPVVIANLPTGIYRVAGNYRICNNDKTIYSSSDDNLFLVYLSDHDIGIKKITSSTIINYVIENNSIISTNTFASTDWILNQDFSTKTYVDEKIAALDFITKSEIEAYVSSIIDEKFDAIIDAKIEEKINEAFDKADASDIETLS